MKYKPERRNIYLLQNIERRGNEKQKNINIHNYTGNAAG